MFTRTAGRSSKLCNQGEERGGKERKGRILRADAKILAERRHAGQ